MLQTIDLASGAGLEETAGAQTVAESIADRTSEVVALARVALESTVVRRAVASNRWWREVLVAAPAGDTVVEGFIDLLFEEPDGLVVVDYKTDALRSDAGIDAAVQRYRLQVGAYVMALERATGRAVKEVVLLFVRPKREVILRDVAALAHAADAAIAAMA